MWVYIFLFFVILGTIFALICTCCNENEPHYYELDKKLLAPPKKEAPKPKEEEKKPEEENKMEAPKME